MHRKSSKLKPILSGFAIAKHNLEMLSNYSIDKLEISGDQLITKNRRLIPSKNCNKLDHKNIAKILINTLSEIAPHVHTNKKSIEKKKKLLIKIQHAICFNMSTLKTCEKLFDPEIVAFKKYITDVFAIEGPSMAKRSKLKNQAQKIAGINLSTPLKDSSNRFVFNQLAKEKSKEMKLGPILIFLETQTRKVLSNISPKYKYFSYAENKNPKQIYKYTIPNPIEKDLKIQNIGHATLLIQINTFNILTDPIFGNLNPVFYRAQTQPGLNPEELPKIDVIMISHNHRDHLDIPSLKKLIKHQPTVIVPIGDGKLIRNLGFKCVIETTWHDEVTLTKIDHSGKEKQITVTATLANHWTKRGFFDKNLSLANGYLIAPHANHRVGMIYFAGDTAVMDDKYIQEIAAVLHLQMIKYNIAPKLIILSPGGPNYRRTLMQSSHQSTIDGIITTLKLIKALATIENKSKIKKSKPPLEWLDSVYTIFMHHNKFDLAADRFNESLIIMNKILEILVRPELIEYAQKDAFIWQGARDLLQAYLEILESSSKYFTNEQKIISNLLKFINNKVIFPLIGAQVPEIDLS